MPDRDEQDERIAKIFLGVKTGSEVNLRGLGRYRAYLRANLKRPCLLTGSSDFPWEERFILGAGTKNREEYEELKTTRASYTDTFRLMSFYKELYESAGLLVNVRRTSDRKRFLLPLADLKPTDKQSENCQLMNDYSVWLFNEQATFRGSWGCWDEVLPTPRAGRRKARSRAVAR